MLKISFNKRRCSKSIDKIVRAMQREETRATAEVSYETPYAVRVHEDMTPKNWTRPGTGPKYLENPARNGINDGTWVRLFREKITSRATLGAAVKAVATQILRNSREVCPVDTSLLLKSSKVRMLDGSE